MAESWPLVGNLVVARPLGHFNMECLVGAAKLYLDGKRDEEAYFEPRPTLHGAHFAWKFDPGPNETETTSDRQVHALYHLFGDDEDDWMTQGQMYAYMLTKLCADVLDPKQRAFREYLTQSCAYHYDHQGLKVMLGKSIDSGRHQVRLEVRSMGSWRLELRGAWHSSSHGDPTGPTVDSQEYDVVLCANEQHKVDFKHFRGERPKEALSLWSIALDERSLAMNVPVGA